jgi:hypothetical protein
MLFTTSHSEPIHFTSRLCEAIQKLYYHGYFSYLCNAHHLIHWGLINKDKKITLKGVRFVRGDIGVEKMIYVSPRFSNDPDPEILRGDSFIFMKDADANT